MEADKERVEKERVEKERVEKERVEKERVEKEKAEEEKAALGSSGEVIISRSTGTPPHSPKSPSLDLTLHPSPKKAKPAPKFATKLEGGWSLLQIKRQRL
eukprot:g51182.t1